MPRTIAASPRRIQTAILATAILALLAACGSTGGRAAPEVLARWADAGGTGPGRILVTARAASAIAGAEAQGPHGQVHAASLPGRPGQGRDYGVSLHGSSDTGIGMGLSLDALADAIRPPMRRRDATIALPAEAADSYRRNWQDWQVVVRFEGGPTVVQPAPEPRL